MSLWPFRRKPFLDPETAAWHQENFDWLIAEFGESTQFLKRQLVLPDAGSFIAGGKTGHRLAEFIFAQVKVHAGLEGWHAELVPMGHELLGYEGQNVIRPVREHGAAGTFSAGDGNLVTITYTVDALDQPQSLIATLAHELAHYLLATATRELPVPPDEEEFLTDLTAVFLGFGVFQSNDRFTFEQTQDGLASGWQWKRKGYLPEDDLIFATALFLNRRGMRSGDARRYLKPHLAKKLLAAEASLS